MNDHGRGLYRKYFVQRLDPAAAKQDEILVLRQRYVDEGQMWRDRPSLPPPKHERCEFFVLDLNHDPHALAAISAYADSCALDYPDLAMDLRRKIPRAARPSGVPKGAK